MLLEEAKKQWAKKSKRTDRAREAKAAKDRKELQKEEEAKGSPAGVPTYRFRSFLADSSREMLERMDNLVDQSRKVSVLWIPIRNCLYQKFIYVSKTIERLTPSYSI